jgi:hypothetical protein
VGSYFRLCSGIWIQYRNPAIKGLVYNIHH